MKMIFKIVSTVFVIICFSGVGKSKEIQFPHLASAASYRFPVQGTSLNTWDTDLRNFFSNMFNLDSGWLLDPLVDCRNYSSINTAVNAIGSSTKTLLVASPQALTGTLTIPANITLLITNAGLISKVSTYTLAIDGPFSAGRYQVFSGFSPGDVTFGAVKEVYPEWWTANTTPAVTDMTAAIISATAAMASQYEGGKTVVFSNSFYKITNTMAFNISNASMVHWYASSKATIYCQQPAGQWAMTIDFDTGKTYNFIAFHMTNISFNDFTASKTRKGVQTKRLLRSNWANVEFKWLKEATDFTADSDLNYLVNCSWHSNVTGWHSSDGIANNNVFTNCQWQYNTGTSLDSTGTGGNTLMGGDFEPLNANPVLIAYYMNVIGTRFEQNVGGVYIRDLGGNKLEVDINSAGDNSALPAIQLEGIGSVIRPRVLLADQGVTCLKTSSRNTIYLTSFIANQHYPFIVDRGLRNTFIIGGSVQRGDGIIMEAGSPDQLVPADPTTWIKTNCRVANSGNGLYTVTRIGSGSAGITYQLAGNYSGIALAATLQALNVDGQPLFTINGNEIGTTVLSYYGDGASRSIAATSSSIRLTNPVIGYTMRPGEPGASFTIRDIRATAGGFFPE